jgi:hypothetical protein
MNSIKKNIFALAALLFSLNASFVLAQQTSNDANVGSVTTPTGEAYQTPKALPKAITRITFYRPADCKLMATITPLYKLALIRICA